MNNFIEINGKIINKNCIKKVEMSPVIEDSGFICGTISIFFEQKRQLIQERIDLSIENALDECSKIEGTPCYPFAEDETWSTDICKDCIYTKKASKLVRLKCLELLTEQFTIIQKALGTDEILKPKSPTLVLGEDGQLSWKH
ncbi:hypothetical protein ACJDU8_21555 [Clostridium sp. WILCCON 0269]|uniref:Uncharacterized protein n=1 Tax=Candidatus Clostridium eludens TaxID=3381663 RepID=A0ABW8SSE7_9CLOT